jgi:DnaK suppressor protein
MTRRDVLLRLHTNLLARKERLSKKLAGELAYLHDGNAADAAGDSADLAFDAAGDEIASRLAELDDRELLQIERALTRCEEGTYGLCEICQKPILLARLNALPYTPACIKCERDTERRRSGRGRPSTGNWGQVADAQAPMQDERINLAELEMDQSRSARR